MCIRDRVYVTFHRGSGPLLQNATIDLTLPPGIVPVGATPLQLIPTGLNTPPCANSSATLTLIDAPTNRYRITPGVTTGVGCKSVHGGVAPLNDYAFVVHTRLDPNHVFTSGTVDVAVRISVDGPVRPGWSANQDTEPLTIEVPFQLTLDADALPCAEGPTFGLTATVTNANEATAGQVTLTFPTISCLLYTSPSPRDRTRSRMPSSA